ncbi:hypothetical protein IQ254_05940 [Nodosilinea sp. LEGE 07088]|uniref:hypothetical protein n=1 Tax=Nodosilinea sp. LEGE 07088 TaxID=2777968 RepID=UPI001880690F|nr:hypothetical protein [Nodosilinea sp. LEGE 07088]MBE9136747.1 hypothetical protein [Nodosilinea sp. LEGE 07088]
MNNQARSALTVLASSLVFGLAGLWLAPNEPKAVAVGALTGTVGAIGYTQQDNRLRQLAAQQRRPLNRAPSPRQHQVTSQSNRTTKNLEIITKTTADYGTKISEIERILRHQAGQTKLSQNEINRIRKRLEELEFQGGSARAGDEGVNSDFQPIELRLEALETQIQAMISGRSTYQVEVPISAPETEDDSPEDDVAQTVIQWFNLRQIDVENYYEPDAKVDALLDGLSLYLGEHYTTLRQFHWRLRNSVGRRAYINLNECNPREKSIHNQFLKKLRSCDYLSFGRMIKDKDSNDYILAAPYNRSDVQGFLDGGWFERFVYYKVVELLNSEGVEYQYLRNLKIIYQGNHNAEIDLFFLIDGKPLLIECKASQDCDMTQITGYRDRLYLEGDQVLLVALNIDDSGAHLRSKNWNVNVANQDSFLSFIREIIPAEVRTQLDAIPEESGLEAGEVLPHSDELNESVDDDLKSFFKGRGLNQSPETRKTILMSLIQFFDGAHEPIGFNDLTKILRDNMRDGSAIGRNKILEVLNCLRYSDMFRDEKNKPIRGNVSQLIYGLSSAKPKTLERKCIEFYADKVIQLFDSDFFKDDDNCREFERLTNGEVPVKYKSKLDR